jgi:hypothetical protein
MKVLGHGVIRVIVKALILPECIHGRRHIPLPSAQASEAPMCSCPISNADSDSVSTCLWYCGLVRDRGMVRTSTMSRTPASPSKSTNTTIGRVECPMVRNGLARFPKCIWAPHQMCLSLLRRSFHALVYALSDLWCAAPPGVTHALGVRRACVLAVSRHLHGRAPRRRHINHT